GRTAASQAANVGSIPITRSSELVAHVHEASRLACEDAMLHSARFALAGHRHTDATAATYRTPYFRAPEMIAARTR
ncbi:MAG: hypothetical protein KDI32_07675, partial [Pseudomonadales bacterium]|nr:hypothetical protein [Pseudomonadales bacterium]